MSGIDAVTQQPSYALKHEGIAKPSPKKIFVCCDGTGNEFAGKDATNSNSNVVKFYTALELNQSQYAYYHPGVGTMGDPTKSGFARAVSVVKGLAFGDGFRDNVLDAYRYLMQQYNAGDKVYVIGFSRGAYTARALCGLLHGYGLLCRGNEEHILYAWRSYTQQVQDQRQKDRRTIETDFSFCNTFSHKDFMLHFVGLWDTVSSVGWITTPLRLLHLAQNSTIINGRHAVSIDERRCFYQDNLWGPPMDVQYPPFVLAQKQITKSTEVQDIVQAWFAGVHSDVGGSYPQLTSGLSNITLQWMMEEAEKFDAVFDGGRRDIVLGKPVDDPYGVSAAIVPLYEKPTSNPVHRSLKGLWWILELFPHRYYDRDDFKEKMRIPWGAWRNIPSGALVHSSVRDRIAADVCYRPCSVDLEEIATPASPSTPKQGTPGGYFVFTPKACRGAGWRENWLVVFLVSVTEIAVGLYLLALLLMGVGYVAVWLAELVGWLGRHAMPEVNYPHISYKYEQISACLKSRLPPSLRHVLQRWWPAIASLVIVVSRFVVASLRRLRS